MVAYALQLRGRTIEGLERDLIRMLLYIGRYARQPRSELIDLTMAELRLWADETREMLKAEEEAAKRGREED